MGSFVSGLDRETVRVDGRLSFVGSGDVLSRQRVADSLTTKHCTIQSTQDEALVSPRFYQRDQRKVKSRIAGHMRHSGYPVDALLAKARHDAGHRKTQRDTLELPVCTTR